MAQQVSKDAALAAYRKRCEELFTANVLLEARVADLEQEVGALRAQAAPAPPKADVAPPEPTDGREPS